MSIWHSWRQVLNSFLLFQNNSDITSIQLRQFFPTKSFRLYLKEFITLSMEHHKEVKYKYYLENGSVTELKKFVYS